MKGERLKLDARTGVPKKAAKKSVMYEIQNRHLFSHPGPNKLALSCNPNAYVYDEEMQIWGTKCV